MTKKKKSHNNCDCIVCNAKCPECGSTAVDITYKVEYSIGNDTKGGLDICTTDSYVELHCVSCLETYIGNRDSRLSDLCFSLAKELGIGDEQITIKHGNIKTKFRTSIITKEV